MTPSSAPSPTHQQLVYTKSSVDSGHGTLAQFVGHGTVLVLYTSRVHAQSTVSVVAARQYGVLQAGAGGQPVAGLAVTVSTNVRQPPRGTEMVVASVVGHGCVHVATTVAHDSVLHGPHDWHGTACCVNVGVATP